MASHARYIDTRFCPRRVNIGHMESSTRYVEFRNRTCSAYGESSMSNLDDEEFDDVLRVWMDERPHLGLGNDSLLGGIDVSCIYRAYGVRFRALDVGGSCP